MFILLQERISAKAGHQSSDFGDLEAHEGCNIAENDVECDNDDEDDDDDNSYIDENSLNSDESDFDGGFEDFDEVNLKDNCIVSCSSFLNYCKD